MSLISAFDAVQRGRDPRQEEDPRCNSRLPLVLPIRAHRPRARPPPTSATTSPRCEDISSLADSVKRLAAEQIGSSVEDVQDKAKEKISDLEAHIRRNPSQAALIAAGIGFVFGLILSR